MPPRREERELGRKMELPLGRGNLQGRWQTTGEEKSDAKKKKKAPQKLGHRGSGETDSPSGKGCLRVTGFAGVASLINK